MQFTQDQHRLWVSSFFNFKIGEFEFFLRAIIECCDESMTRYLGGEQSDMQKERRVVYFFSAFTNAVQTLRDAGSTFLEPKIAWKDIRALRHGNFIYLSRNAATHDGNPVISGWADGRYFVPHDIERFDSKGELVNIPAPDKDIAQVCLEFTYDFCGLLADRLASLKSAQRPMTNIAVIERMFMSSPMVPEFARDLFKQNKAAIERAISQMEFDPARRTAESLSAIAQFCNDRMNAETQG